MFQNLNGFWPARFSTVPTVRRFSQVASPTFKTGYPVFTAAGLLDECGADPALIAGIALQDQSTNPGYSAANSPSPITGQSTTASVALALQNVEFVGQLVNGSATVIAPTAGDIDAQYGITKETNTWRVDKAKVGASARVQITGIDTDNNLVYFKVLAAYQQYAA